MKIRPGSFESLILKRFANRGNKYERERLDDVVSEVQENDPLARRLGVASSIEEMENQAFPWIKRKRRLRRSLPE